MVIKGLERNIGSLYEARRLLLGLDSTEVSMTTKNVSEVTTKTPVDPLVTNNGITSYWINVLMQHLRLTETGVLCCVVCVCVCVCVRAVTLVCYDKWMVWFVSIFRCCALSWCHDWLSLWKAPPLASSWIGCFLRRWADRNQRSGIQIREGLDDHDVYDGHTRVLYVYDLPRTCLTP